MSEILREPRVVLYKIYYTFCVRWRKNYAVVEM